MRALLTKTGCELLELIELAPVLVCRVPKTRCPVSAALMASWMVIRSRISPTMMTSGSARRNARMAAAKVKSIFGNTWTWRKP